MKAIIVVSVAWINVVYRSVDGIVVLTGLDGSIVGDDVIILSDIIVFIVVGGSIERIIVFIVAGGSIERIIIVVIVDLC